MPPTGVGGSIKVNSGERRVQISRVLSLRTQKTNLSLVGKN